MRLKLNVFCLITVCLISGIISLFLGQAINWDLLNYHFYNGYSLLNNRLSYDIAPAQIQTYLNPLMDVFCYLLISNVKPYTIGFFVGFIQGINIFLLFKIIELYYEIKGIKDFLVVIAVSFAGYLGAASISEIGTFFGDNIISIFILASLYCLLIADKRSADTNSKNYYVAVFLSSYLSGFAAGLKLTGAIYLLSLLLIFALYFRKKLKTIMLAAVCSGAGFLTTSGFWMKTLYEHYGSPLFPFYNEIFKSPFYQNINFADDRFLPTNIYEKLFYPFYFPTLQGYYVSEMPFIDIRLAICYIAIIFYCTAVAINKLVLKQKYKLSVDKKTGILITYCVISYIVWQSTFSIYRYLIPIEMLSLAAIFIIIISVNSNKKFITASTIIVITLIMVVMVPLDWGRVKWHDYFFDVRIDERFKQAKPGSIVLLLDHESLSYVVPYFPKDIRFIRINGNFPNPNEQDMLQEHIKNIIKSESVIFVMTDGIFPETNALLAKYNLKASDTLIYRVKTNLHDNIIIRGTVNLSNG